MIINAPAVPCFIVSFICDLIRCILMYAATKVNNNNNNNNNNSTYNAIYLFYVMNYVL